MLSRLRNHRLWMVIVLGITIIFSLAGDLTLYTTLPVNAGGMLLTLTQIGVILSANRFIRLISNPITGYLLDKGKRRPIYLVGLLLGSLSTLTYALTQNFIVFLFGRLIWGFAWSFIIITANTMIIDSTLPAHRGRYLGILHLMISLGLSINPLLGGFLADRLGFRPTMLLCGLLTGVGLMLAVSLLPESRQKVLDCEPVIEGTIETSDRTPPSLFYQIFRDFKLSSFGWQIWLVVGLTFILAFAGNGLVMGTTGLFLTQEVGIRVVWFGGIIGVAALTGFVLGFRSLLIAVTAPLAGGFSDRGLTRWPAIQVGLGLAIMGMLALGSLRALPAILLGISLISLGEGVLISVLPAILGDHAAEEERGKVLGVTYMAGDLGSALAPVLVFSLVLVVPLRVVYLASAGAFVVGLLFVWGRRFIR